MAWTQYPVPPGEAGQWDDVADLHVRSIDHHAVDEQLHQSAALLEGGSFEASGHCGAEGFNTGGEGLGVLGLRRLSNQPLLLLAELGSALLQQVAALV